MPIIHPVLSDACERGTDCQGDWRPGRVFLSSQSKKRLDSFSRQFLYGLHIRGPLVLDLAHLGLNVLPSVALCRRDPPHQACYNEENRASLDKDEDRAMM